MVGRFRHTGHITAMFDLTSSKLLILGIVALIVVGPKELPFLLRTVGKYVAMLRRQANEFRAQFDEAMREAELDGIKKELEAVARDTTNTLHSAHASVTDELHAASHDVHPTIHNRALEPTSAALPENVHQFDALNGLEAPAEPVTPVVVPPTHGEPQSPTPPLGGTPHAAEGMIHIPVPAPELLKTGA